MFLLLVADRRLIRSNGGVKGHRHWIALTDIKKEGKWVYGDGKAANMATVGWYKREPNGKRRENCAVDYGSKGQIIDVRCRYKYKSICEFDTCAK